MAGASICLQQGIPQSEENAPTKDKIAGRKEESSALYAATFRHLPLSRAEFRGEGNSSLVVAMRDTPHVIKLKKIFVAQLERQPRPGRNNNEAVDIHRSTENFEISASPFLAASDVRRGVNGFSIAKDVADRHSRRVDIRSNCDALDEARDIAAGQVKDYWRAMHKYQLSFIRDVAVPLFGQSLVDVPVLAELTRDEITTLLEESSKHRAVHRLTKAPSPELSTVLVFPDYCAFKSSGATHELLHYRRVPDGCYQGVDSNGTKSSAQLVPITGPVISVEIKAKMGFFPGPSRSHSDTDAGHSLLESALGTPTETLDSPACENCDPGTSESPRPPSVERDHTLSSTGPCRCATSPLVRNELPEMSKQHRVCRFHLVQHRKLSQGRIQHISKYCPLDMFSGCPHRMESAIFQLLQNPQNNLRIFRNRRQVFGADKKGSEETAAPDLRSFDQLLAGFLPGDGGKMDFDEAQKKQLPQHQHQHQRQPEQVLNCVSDCLHRRRRTTEEEGRPTYTGTVSEPQSILAQQCQDSRKNSVYLNNGINAGEHAPKEQVQRVLHYGSSYTRNTAEIPPMHDKRHFRDISNSTRDVSTGDLEHRPIAQKREPSQGGLTSKFGLQASSSEEPTDRIRNAGFDRASSAADGCGVRHVTADSHSKYDGDSVYHLCKLIRLALCLPLVEDRCAEIVAGTVWPETRNCVYSTKCACSSDDRNCDDGVIDSPRKTDVTEYDCVGSGQHKKADHMAAANKHEIPRSSVLCRLLQVQQLCSLDVATVFGMFFDGHQSEDFIAGRFPQSSLPSNGGLRSDTKRPDESPAQFKSRMLWKFLVALTARDCSLMLTMQKIDTSRWNGELSESRLNILRYGGEHYLLQIGVVDLEPKPLDRITKHLEEDHSMEQHFFASFSSS